MVPAALSQALGEGGAPALHVPVEVPLLVGAVHQGQLFECDRGWGTLLYGSESRGLQLALNAKAVQPAPGAH